MECSVIICAHNRAASLARTLAALQTLHIPDQRAVEFIVVDNASVDETAVVIRSFHSALPIALLHEARANKSHALNLARRWKHGRIKQLRIRCLNLLAKLLTRRVLNPWYIFAQGELPAGELSYLADLAFCRQFLRERRRPHHSSCRGPVRRSSEPTRPTAEPFNAQLIAPQP